MPEITVLVEDSPINIGIDSEEVVVQAVEQVIDATIQEQEISAEIVEQEIGVVVENGVFYTGGSGGNPHYIYTNPIGSDIWYIQHNLLTYPHVYCTDISGSSQLEGRVDYIDVNTLRIVFAYSVTGQAYLS